MKIAERTSQGSEWLCPASLFPWRFQQRPKVCIPGVDGASERIIRFDQTLHRSFLPKRESICNTVNVESPQQSSGQFSIDLSSIETQRLLFFDRFSVFRQTGFVEIHFGFFGRAAQLQKGLIAVLSAQSLEEQKEGLMQYLKLIGMPEEVETLKGCDLRGGDADVITADVIGMARHGSEIAEVTFHTFSWKVVVETIRLEQQNAVRPVCAAILRCNLDLQKRLILDLYADAAVK